jgi:hypothetical protein
MANEVKITIGADTRKADQAVKGFRERLDGVAKNARMAGVAFAAMGGAGVIAIKSFATAALEQERAMSTLAVVMANAGESFDVMEDHIMSTTAALQKKTNYGDEAQLRVLAQLVPMLGNTNDALAALPAIMNVAAVTNKDFESTVMTMGPVLAGLTDKIRGTALEFDKSQGPMERVDVIMEQLGGAAEAQVDPFTQLSMAVGDLKEKMGFELLPELRKVLGAFTSLTEKLQAVNPRLIRMSALVLGGVTAFALIAAPILLLIGLLPFLSAGFVALNISMGTVALVILGLAAAIEISIRIWKNWDKIVEKVKKTWERVSGKMSDIFRSKWMWIMPGGIFVKAMLFIYDNWEKIWGGMKETFYLVVGAIERKLQSWLNNTIAVINGIISGINALGGWLGVHIEPMADVTISLGDAWEVVKDKTLDAAKAIKGELSAALRSLKSNIPEATKSWELFNDELAASIDRMAAVHGAAKKLEEEGKAPEEGGGGAGGATGGGGGGGSTKYSASSFGPEVWTTTTDADGKTTTTSSHAPRRPASRSYTQQRDKLREIEATENMSERAVRFMEWFGNSILHPDISAAAFPKLAKHFPEYFKKGRKGGSTYFDDPTLDSFAGGGRVPGPEGSPQLAMVHGGEMILNRKQQGAGIVINITGNHITGEMELDRLVRRAITSAGVRGAF